MSSELQVHIHLNGIQLNEQSEWLMLYDLEGRKFQSNLATGGGSKIQLMFQIESLGRHV